MSHEYLRECQSLPERERFVDPEIRRVYGCVDDPGRSRRGCLRRGQPWEPALLGYHDVEARRADTPANAPEDLEARQPWCTYDRSSQEKRGARAPASTPVASSGNCYGKKQSPIALESAELACQGPSVDRGRNTDSSRSTEPETWSAGSRSRRMGSTAQDLGDRTPAPRLTPR